MECPKCGMEIGENETSCKNCGERIKHVDISKTEDEEEKEEEVSEEVAETEDIGSESVTYITPEQYVATQKKSNRGSMILPIIVVLIILIITFISIFVSKQIFGKHGTAISEPTGIEDTPGRTSKKDPENKTGEDGTKKAESPVTTEVVIGSFVFSIPNNYAVTVEKENSYRAYDANNKVNLVFTIAGATDYQTFYAGREAFVKSLSDTKLVVKSYQEEMYEGRKWFVIKGEIESVATMYAVTSIGKSSTFHVTIVNLGVRTNEEIFTEVTKIVSNVRMKDNSSSDNSGSINNGGSNSGDNGSGSGSSGNGTIPTNPGSSNSVSA